jgi:hypothetical protein
MWRGHITIQQDYIREISYRIVDQSIAKELRAVVISMMAGVPDRIQNLFGDILMMAHHRSTENCKIARYPITYRIVSRGLVKIACVI